MPDTAYTFTHIDADGMAVYRDPTWVAEPMWTIPAPPVTADK